MNQLVFSKPAWFKTERITTMLSYKRSLPFFLVETFFIACLLSCKVVGISAAPTIDEFFAFSSAFVKIVAWDVRFAWTGFLLKKAGLRVLTSPLACGKIFEPVGIASAPTIDEFFAFFSAFVKIVAWDVCLAWTGYLWKLADLRVLTSPLACGKIFEPVGIASAPTIDEFFAFASAFVKIVAWDVRLAWTGFLLKKAGLRVLTSPLACGKSFEPVGITSTPTIDEFFAFSSAFVKIVAWDVCLAWTGYLWKLADLRTSPLACGKSFEVVCIAAAPTIDEIFAFSSHFVKIVA